MDMLSELAKQAGGVGTVLALCLLAIRKLHSDSQQAQIRYITSLQEIQEKWVRDAQAMIDKLLDLNNKWNLTLTSQAEASDGLVKVMTELRELVMELCIERKK